jgi:hypothetical protein
VRRRRRTGVMVATLCVVALVASGCEYLQMALGQGPVPIAPGTSFDPGFSFDPGVSFDPNDPGFSFDPEASDIPDVTKATYTHGSATLTIGDQVIKLDRLVGKAYLSDQFGGQASWTDGSGWYAQAFGVSASGSEFGEDAFVSFDHVFGGQHWTVGDPSVCEITITKADETGLAGTAVCPGARWADLMAAYASTSGPVFIEGQAPFDAKLSFEATP